MSTMKKISMVGIAVVALASGVVATSTPASAWGRGGFGGPFAGGLIGGLAAGAILGAATRPAYGGYNYGYAPAYGYDPVPVYNPCYRSQSPVYDVYGNFAGMRSVRVCN